VSGVQVQLDGDDPSGLAELVAGLIEQNLARDPARASHLRGSSIVVLDASDAEVAVTVRLAPGSVRVADGVAPGAHVRVVADAERLLALAAAPLRAGLPDPLRRDGRAVLADITAGRVRVHGLVRHPVRLARFTSLLSVHEPSSFPRRWLPTMAVLAVVLVTTLGGFAVSAALSEPAGPAVSIPGVVSVQPLSGWGPSDGVSVARRPAVGLTRGSGTLVAVAWGSFAGDAQSLAGEVGSDLLLDSLDQLSVSEVLTPVSLDGELVGQRFTFNGTDRVSGAALEGEVTTGVASDGQGVVFVGLAPEGVLAFVDGDLHTMIAAAMVGPGA